MSASNKLDSATGIVTFAVAGISGSFTAADAQQWGQVMITLSPYLLIGYLIWRIHKLAQQHETCIENHDKLQNQLIFSYNVLQTISRRADLPEKEDFLAGNFDYTKFERREQP